MENKMKFYLYILFELAKHRESEKNTDKNQTIKIGSMDLAQNFIALICMDGEYLLDKYIEDKWALFVPSIHSSLSYLESIGFVKIKRDGKREELFFMGEPFKSFKNDSSWLKAKIEGKKIKRIQTLIKGLYPLNGEKEEQKDEKIKLTVRVASCIWGSGRANSEIDDNEVTNCFKTVRKVWGNYSTHEQKIKRKIGSGGEVFPEKGNVVVKCNNKFYLEIKPSNVA